MFVHIVCFLFISTIIIYRILDCFFFLLLRRIWSCFFFCLGSAFGIDLTEVPPEIIFLVTFQKFWYVCILKFFIRINHIGILIEKHNILLDKLKINIVMLVKSTKVWWINKSENKYCPHLIPDLVWFGLLFSVVWLIWFSNSNEHKNRKLRITGLNHFSSHQF